MEEVSETVARLVTEEEIVTRLCKGLLVEVSLWDSKVVDVVALDVVELEVDVEVDELLGGGLTANSVIDPAAGLVLFRQAKLHEFGILDSPL